MYHPEKLPFLKGKSMISFFRSIRTSLWPTHPLSNVVRLVKSLKFGDGPLSKCVVSDFRRMCRPIMWCVFGARMSIIQLSSRYSSSCESIFQSYVHLWYVWKGPELCKNIGRGGLSPPLRRLCHAQSPLSRLWRLLSALVDLIAQFRWCCITALFLCFFFARSRTS